MNNKFYNKLYWAAIMFLMASCISEKEDLGAINENQTIEFSTYIKQGSRATDKTTFDVGDSFGLWGCKTTGDYNNSFSSNFMSNVEVTKTEAGWEYSPLALCPTNTAERLSFIAIYPYNESQSIASSYTYTVNADPAQQEDVLWGTVTNAHANDRNGSAINGDETEAAFEATTGAVNFKFKHALCKVQFHVKLDMDYSSLATATLKSFTLNSVYQTGKLQVNADLSNITWGTFSNPQNYTLLTEDKVLTANEASVGDALLLIPQTYPTSANVSLNLTYEYTVEDETKTVRKNYPLYVNWEPGKSYKYTVTIPLNLETISVSTEIEEREGDTSLDPAEALPENAVDLGLSVFWATHNVGASAPTVLGNQYAWACITTQSEYYRSDYKYYDSSTHIYDPLIENISGNKNYDVACSNWGVPWRMPKKSDFEELMNNCTWEWQDNTNTEFNGVTGYKVTSNVQGYTDKFIFLPAALYWTGTRTNRYNSSSDVEKGYRWASCFLGTSAFKIDDKIRYEGYYIRPVHSK